MGLGISWYRGINKRTDVLFDEDGEPKNIDSYFRPCVNSDFPEQAGNLEHRGVYEYAEANGFRAGSYGGYNHWRETLANLAGYPLTPYRSHGRIEESHAAACWGGAEGPFAELINFSDCEGVIGTETAKKLAGDFAAFQNKADAEDEFFRDRYQLWRQAFEKAADNGAVEFH